MPKKRTECPKTAALLPLSLRELEVVQMVLKGYDDQRIGARLFITRDTVQSHKRNIRRKLGLQPRLPFTRVLVEYLAGWSYERKKDLGRA